MSKITDVLAEEKIEKILSAHRQSGRKEVLAVLKKSVAKRELTLDDVAVLIGATDPDLVKKIFDRAHQIKQDIYGERLVLFAPLYASSFCVNDCQYCAFHCRNQAKRKKLSLSEVAKQVRILEDMGHKRILLEFGEDPRRNTIDYVVKVIEKIYQTKSGSGEIRRVNVNIAATTVADYKKLKKAGIGTYQLFQETYHQETYKKMHRGPKANYARQLFAHDRAFAAGIDDVGLGVLFGLYDWRFEVLALVSHAKYLSQKFGVGPHTISVPRWQPANGVSWDEAPYAVSENELLRIIAILRIAVPYTGMIISTRERSIIRSKAFAIGISQTSAASRTAPGGYGQKEKLTQFITQDHRSVAEVIEGMLKDKLLPSFCTACYRLGRTGHEFMGIAKPGHIQNFCRPNAILTFKEYLEDYAPAKMRPLGERVIKYHLNQIKDVRRRQETKEKLKEIEAGKRDLYF